MDADTDTATATATATARALADRALAVSYRPADTYGAARLDAYDRGYTDALDACAAIIDAATAIRAASAPQPNPDAGDDLDPADRAALERAFVAYSDAVDRGDPDALERYADAIANRDAGAYGHDADQDA